MILKFRVKGMTCAACSARVEKVSSQVEGVSSVEVNLLAGKMTVKADNSSVTEKIIAAVNAAGYDIVPEIDELKRIKTQSVDSDLRIMKNRIICSAIFLTILMYFTMGNMMRLPIPRWYRDSLLVSSLMQLFLTIPVLFLNRSYFSRGLKALWHRAPNMDSLIAIGSGASMFFGIFVLFRISYAAETGQNDVLEFYIDKLYFESAAMILTLITLGKFFEARAKSKTGDAIAALMDITPKMATLRRGNSEFTIPVEEVNVGDTVLVRAGGSIPVDGTVIFGTATVDQSALTGESVPVYREVGDSVAAATINREGYLEIRAERVGEDTSLSKIIHMVEEAGGSKAPIARMADKISGIFVPVIMSISLIAFLIWLLVGESLEFAITVGVSVLVISCPCALGLATPVAIMVGTGRGAGLGVLYKNAEVLENLHKVNTVVFDKTGTLTKGSPEVTDVFPASVDKTELIKLAASIEKLSEHPFAKAIVAYSQNITLYEIEDFQVLPGKGISGIVNGKKCFGGNQRLMHEIGIVVEDFSKERLGGNTPLYFACETEYLGAIMVCDVIKDDASASVNALQNMDIDVIMLTGDQRITAKAIAESVGIEHVISDVLPWDKASQIQQLQKDGKNVLMVGDGINDAPALTAADVGMAIGKGTDIAIESADIVLMKQSLSGIVQAIELSKATIRNIKQNLFWAFFYNCLGIPIAAGVLYPVFGIELNPMIGAAAMSMSSVFVVTNALRLRLFQPKCKDIIYDKDKIINFERNEVMQTVLNVEGMMCVHCKARVESVCKAVVGVETAVVDLQKKTVTVTGDAAEHDLKKAITDAGYQVIE